MKKIVVTGGAGYLGSVLVPELLHAGYEVTVFDNFLFRQTGLSHYCHNPHLKIVRGDCRDQKTLESLVAKADIIIPLAALVGAPLCSRDKVGARTINEDAIRFLCRIASPSQQIIYPTTNSGYGIGKKGQFCTEETPLNPISLYGITKVNAERLVLERNNSITFRLATVFGTSPRMRLDLLVNDFVYRAFHDRAVVLFESHFKRNFIHIRDVANVFLHALNNFDSMKNEAYNVGLEDANLSKHELCTKIKEHIPGFVFMEAPIGEDPDKRNYVVSNKKILSTGFKTTWSLDRGIIELMKAYTIIKNNTFANI